MFSIDPGQWATSFAYSQAYFEGTQARGVSWWGEYRPSVRTNVGLRFDDPGGRIGATVYADRQWFTPNSSPSQRRHAPVGRDLARGLGSMV